MMLTVDFFDNRFSGKKHAKNIRGSISTITKNSNLMRDVEQKQTFPDI